MWNTEFNNNKLKLIESIKIQQITFQYGCLFFNRYSQIDFWYTCPRIYYKTLVASVHFDFRQNLPRSSQYPTHHLRIRGA